MPPASLHCQPTHVCFCESHERGPELEGGIVCDLAWGPTLICHGFFEERKKKMKQGGQDPYMSHCVDHFLQMSELFLEIDSENPRMRGSLKMLF